MDRHKNDWQNIADVLTIFGKRSDSAREAYQVFVADGVEQGRRPELVGGGLVRSQGGWSEVRSMRRQGIGELSDERILGSGEFVERLVEEADEIRRGIFARRENLKRAEEYLWKICSEEGISIAELQSGSRRGTLPAVRLKIAGELIGNYGLSLAESARRLGVSTSGISKALSRSKST